ncbi:hypothetical protein ID866_10733 [Astraeus odoratus]|nr:hypothetical protein ID866_10733 [Astraeus odoratus]
MSSPCRTSSPHKCCLAKTKAPKECTEEEWKLISKDEVEKRAWEEAKHLVCKKATKKTQEEAERKAEEECRAQEEAARVKEEAKRLAKEATVRKEAAKRAVEAAEDRADTKRRVLKE